jgi:hypothetical protein
VLIFEALQPAPRYVVLAWRRGLFPLWLSRKPFSHLVLSSALSYAAVLLFFLRMLSPPAHFPGVLQARLTLRRQTGISISSGPDGAILSQTVYNPGAQRGINSVAAFGQNLLISNCAVGANDKNLWYYWVDGNSYSVTLKDSVNLRVNPLAPQVFDFCTIWGIFNGQVGFFSSTEEGALWVGTIDPSQHMTVLGYQTVFGSLGSALGFNGKNLIVINYNLYEFTTQPNQIGSPGQNPERLPLKLLPPNLVGKI